jgi:hypothetical protein
MASRFATVQRRRRLAELYEACILAGIDHHPDVVV